MPHRSQCFAELCRACKRPSAARCSDCSAPVCAEHRRCPPCHRVWLVLPPKVVVKRPPQVPPSARALLGSLGGAAAVAATWVGLGGAAAGLGAAGACAVLGAWQRRQRGARR